MAQVYRNYWLPEVFNDFFDTDKMPKTNATAPAINVTKAKQLTNVRASGSDDKARVIPKTVMSLEECLEYIKEDELVEVTPKSMRMRKLILDHMERKRANKD